MQPEAKLQRQIQKALKERWPSIFIFKVHGGPYQRAGLPDLLFCLNGRFMALEVKMPGKFPTQLQHKAIEDIRNAGGCVAWTTSVDDAVEMVNFWHDLE